MYTFEPDKLRRPISDATLEKRWAMVREEMKKEEDYLSKVTEIIKQKLEKSLKKEEKLKEKTMDFKKLVGTEYSNKAQSDENKMEFTFSSRNYFFN